MTHTVTRLAFVDPWFVTEVIVSLEELWNYLVMHPKSAEQFYQKL
jgi:hypothetical protein